MECANCSLHATVGCALSEDRRDGLLSTVPRLPAVPQSFHLRVQRRAGGVANWTRHVFTQGSNDAAELRGSFQETAPRRPPRTSVVANHRSEGESSMVVTTLVFIAFHEFEMTFTHYCSI